MKTLVIASIGVSIITGTSLAVPVDICPDVDGDGVVTEIDFSIALTQYCQMGNPFDFQGDTFVDGVVNLFDVVPILACFDELYPLGTHGCGTVLCEPPLLGQFRLGAVGTDMCAGGNAISPLGGAPIYQHPSGSDFPPEPTDVCLTPELEFDSYISAGGGSVSCASPSSSGVVAMGSFSASSLDADWFPNAIAVPPVSFMESVPAPIPLLGEESVFIARLTVQRGAPILNTPMRIFLQDETGWRQITAVINGPGVTLDDDGIPLARPYGIRLNLVIRTNLTSFGPADVYDFYVASNPVAPPPDICPDVNLDGVVNFVDIIDFLSNVQFCAINATLSQGDTFRDGVVNLFDLVPIGACWLSEVPPGTGGCASRICEPPLAAEFRLGSIGTDSCLGAFPIRTVQGGPFFQHPLGTDEPPSPALVSVFPNTAFDSYIAAGDEPITGLSDPAPPLTKRGDGFIVNALNFDWTRELGPVFTDSRPSLFPFVSESIFVARNTVQRGERLRRCPIRAYIQDEFGWHRLTMLLDGRAILSSDDGVAMAHSYAVRSYLSAQPDLTSEGFGLADVYDLYLVSDAVSGDEDTNGCVSFADITAVLGNWLNDYRPCSGIGDADGNGITEFGDITFILSEWVNPNICP